MKRLQEIEAKWDEGCETGNLDPGGVFAELLEHCGELEQQLKESQNTSSISLPAVNEVGGKYRKKPVVIDAEQWQGSKESWDKIIEMGLMKWKPGEMGSKTFIIETPEGDHLATSGDWIIKGVRGEFYPCKPDIFQMTYDSVG